MLPDLCQLLESVSTARDFLVEIGGRQDRSLVEFMVSIEYNTQYTLLN